MSKISCFFSFIGETSKTKILNVFLSRPKLVIKKSELFYKSGLKSRAVFYLHFSALLNLDILARTDSGLFFLNKKSELVKLLLELDNVLSFSVFERGRW